MFQVNFSGNVDQVLQDYKRRLTGEAKSKAGVFGEVTDFKSKAGVSGSELVIKATVQEFGNPDNIFFGNPKAPAPIPERPFLRPAIQNKRVVARYVSSLKKLLAEDDTTLEDLITDLSRNVTKQVKTNIEQKRVPPNAAFTVERKGFNDPLVETGQMLNNINWRITKGKI